MFKVKRLNVIGYMHKIQKIIDLVKEAEHKQICSDSCIAGGCKKEKWQCAYNI